MNRNHKKMKTDGLLVLLLFTIFAVCILAVLLTGADLYRKLTENGAETYEHRTAVQYITTRIRQADCLAGVRAEKFEDCDALVMTEEIDGTHYETKLYCYDGYIRELFSEEDSGLMPEDGEPILQAESMKVQMEDNGIRAEITGTDGETQSMFWTLRSGGEVRHEK